MKIQDVLVPIDFSINSIRAVEFAVALVGLEGEVCLLHVIDADFVTRLTEEGFSDPEAALARLREKAESKMAEVLATVPEPRPQMESMIVVGKPFTEILRVAADLDFPMLVLGMNGRRMGDIEEVLFGSTAEKVLRTARIPVVCVPARWTPPNE